MSSQQTLLLVDAHALIYRAFYAFPNLTNPQGQLVNAVYGFARILLTILRDLEPEYVAVAFDHKDKTFRALSYTEYKANRPQMPDELKPQISWVKEIVDILNIPRFEIAGFEADDLIGTLCSQLESAEDTKGIILTGDKDMLQLVNKLVHVYIPSSNKKRGDIEYDFKTVKKLIGIIPRQVPEMKALMGDASDNIPGIKGIGPKTAVKLIQEFSNIDNLFKAVEEDQAHPLLKGALLKKLKEGKNDAFMSRELATINTGAPIKLDLSKCRLTGYNKAEAVAVFEKYGFKSLLKYLPADDFELGLQEALF